MTNIRSSLARALVGILLLVLISPLSAKTSSQQPVDLGRLRSEFAAAVGKDFEIVRDEFKQRANARGGGTYWLAHVKAKHSGDFSLTYRYNYNDSHYSHVERQFNLGIGPKGCRRRPPHAGSYSRFCVSDTIIIPIVINNFTEHRFFLTSRINTKEEDAASETPPLEMNEQDLVDSPVSNAVEGYLHYVGSTSHKSLHRNGGYTLEAYAVFAAERPGRFNLALSTAFPDAPAGIRSSVGVSPGVPVIIVSRDTPVTLLASGHEVRGYTKGYDGREYVSSTSGDSFMTDLLILQPGDRISLKYHTSRRSAYYERRERAGDLRDDNLRDSRDVVPPPRIIKRPFNPNDEYDFTEWLTDYLPR